MIRVKSVLGFGVLPGGNSGIKLKVATQRYVAPVHFDTGHPSTLVGPPANTRNTAFVVRVQAGVPHVLCLASDAQIIETVVAWVAIDVIYRFGPLAMHEIPGHAVGLQYPVAGVYDPVAAIRGNIHSPACCGADFARVWIVGKFYFRLLGVIHNGPTNCRYFCR
jgi:hypothetical protein